MAWPGGQTGGTQDFTLHGKVITGRPADTADKMLEMKYQSSFRLRETGSIVSHNGSTPSPMPEQNQSIAITIHFISLSRFYFIPRLLIPFTLVVYLFLSKPFLRHNIPVSLHSWRRTRYCSWRSTESGRGHRLQNAIQHCKHVARAYMGMIAGLIRR